MQIWEHFQYSIPTLYEYSTDYCESTAFIIYGPCANDFNCVWIDSSLFAILQIFNLKEDQEMLQELPYKETNY